ncbi:MAG: hypothetical protein DMG53_00785 [Acidobacteria bacterium]|nr:MAG: hypothetical protein DMG53_00785 [Acidobacteriota bacterium]
MTEEAKTYKTAGAFRTALETRLQNRARAEGTDLQRLRRQVAFDRFLARMFSKGPKAAYPWVLKGGYAMELRTHTARTTKDIDLTLRDGTSLPKDPNERREQVRAMLQDAAAPPFDDFFEFLVGEAREDLEGAPGGGSRYPVQARMDGRDFARFHVDGHGAVDPRRKTRSSENRCGVACDLCETGDPRRSERTRSAAAGMGACFRRLGKRMQSGHEASHRIRGGARIYADLADLAAGKRRKISEAVFQHVRVIRKKFEGPRLFSTTCNPTECGEGWQFLLAFCWPLDC